MVGVSLSPFQIQIEFVVNLDPMMDKMETWKTEKVDQFSYTILNTALWGWCTKRAYNGYQNPRAIMRDAWPRMDAEKATGIESLPAWWGFT